MNNKHYITEELELSSHCKIVATKWYACPKWDQVELEYVERSPAHGYCDTTTGIYLTKEDAERIIAFLKDSFDIE